MGSEMCIRDREETDEERPYDSFGRTGMELEPAESEKADSSLVLGATGRQSTLVEVLAQERAGRLRELRKRVQMTWSSC